MKNYKSKLFRILNQSVATRTTVIIAVVVIAILLIGGTFQVKYIRDAVAKETNRQASRSMENAIKEIDNRISTVETAVTTAASYAHMFAPHIELHELLIERLIKANQDISAVTLLYEDNYFPEEGKYFAPTMRPSREWMPRAMPPSSWPTPRDNTAA